MRLVTDALAVVVTGKEAEQDGTERFVRGGASTTATGAVSVRDGKVQRCSGMSTRVLVTEHTYLDLEFVFGFWSYWFWALTAIGKWDSGFFLLS